MVLGGFRSFYVLVSTNQGNVFLLDMEICFT